MLESSERENLEDATARPAEQSLPPIGLGLIERTRILDEMAEAGEKAGLTLVVAPDGFGKTTLLHQYAMRVREDRSRGVARVIDAGGLDESGLYTSLKRMASELEPRMRPLIAVDNLPPMRGSAMEVLPSLLRDLRARGFEVVITSRPGNRDFIAAIGDTHKIGPQGLVVRPREYSRWAKALNISADIDVYEMTQGIPYLVGLLQDAAVGGMDLEAFARGAAQLYRQVIAEFKRERDSLHRLACLLVLTRSGTPGDLDRAGLRIRTETWARLAREYPLFGLDVQCASYRCIAAGSKAMADLRREIVRERPTFTLRAVRALIRRGDVDRAVLLIRMLEHPEVAVEVVSEFPDAFALHGNSAFVRELLERMGSVSVASLPIGMVVATHLSSLVSGDFRFARLMAAEVRRRPEEVMAEISPEAWTSARALSDVWEGCRGVGLPDMDPSFMQGRKSPSAAALELHAATYRRLVGGREDVSLGGYQGDESCLTAEEVDLPGILLECDRLLVDAMAGAVYDARSCDNRLQKAVRQLMARNMGPVAAHVRMVAGCCRMLAGLSVIDERAFVDAGSVAVRVSDFPTQLLCFIGEGWQEYEVGHYVNALFRAQQVLKLADLSCGRLIAWARMLECCSESMNTSQAKLVEEASLLELAHGAPAPADAWVTAIRLCAARMLPELSAWVSLNKEMMLDSGFAAFARQAIRALGDRSRPLLRLLPTEFTLERALSIVEGGAGNGGYDVPPIVDVKDTGQTMVNLFGGFQVYREGRVLTDSAWRRKKACVLAARLVLASGAFVGRNIIMDEVWPEKDYQHAREGLYAGLSSLRNAFGQRQDGPQYVVTQGEGVAVNVELVGSDVLRFDMLARHILLGTGGETSRQVIEACLKLEEIYVGPLYVPNFGDPAFFLRQRRVYLSKFIDCMMRGIEAALEADDLPAASWLVEAALRHAPLREDVIRAAMRVYDLSGRRREVVELYGSHVHHLKEQFSALPEDETRLAYESIVGRMGQRAMMA